MLPLPARYHLCTQLGEGHYSRVFQAEDVYTGQLVAIKQTRADLSESELAFARMLLRREATLLSSLAYQGLAALLDEHIDAQQHALIQEFVPGETLETVLDRRFLTLKEILQIGIDLCAVLDYLHTREPPVIHRDVKPANILLREDSRLAALIDFGIARRFTAHARGSASHRWRPGQPIRRVCDTLTNLGTIGYAAPEQYGEDAQTTPRSDFFSLGVILHQMLTGEDPASASKVSLPTLFQLSSLAGRAHPGLADLVATLVQVDPQHRPASAAAVQHILLGLLLDLHSVPGNRLAPQFFSLAR